VYNEFFGFERAPFNNTPDPAFFFASPSHRQALATMVYGVEQGKGFVMLTGEVGMGKTLLRQTLKKELGDSCVVIEIENPWSSPEEVLSAIRMCVNVPGAENNALFDGLRERLLSVTQQGKRVVLIIDEAHQMSERMIEGIRLLSNVETTTEKLLQIIFIGQNELADMLGRYSMRQIQQRLYLSHHLEAFDLENTIGYVRHRVGVVGGAPDLFDAAALQLLHRESQGTPRVINQLCESALLFAMGRDSHRVGLADMREAVNALRRWRQPEGRPLAAPRSPAPNEVRYAAARGTMPDEDSLLGADPAAQSLPFDLPPKMVQSVAKSATPVTEGLPFALPISPVAAPPAQARPNPLAGLEARGAGAMRYKTPMLLLGAVLLGAGLAWYFTQAGSATSKAAATNPPPVSSSSQMPPSGDRFSLGLSMATSLGGMTAPAGVVQAPPSVAPPVTMSAANVAPPGDIKLPEIANVRVVTIPREGGVARLGSELFGLWNESARDLIGAANPDLKGRIDDLAGGSLIKVPAIKREGLIVQAANGAYYIYYGAFPGQEEAKMELDAVKRLWAASQMTQEKSRSTSIYRVFVGGFSSRAEAVAALDSLWFKHLPSLN